MGLSDPYIASQVDDQEHGKYLSTYSHRTRHGKGRLDAVPQTHKSLEATLSSLFSDPLGCCRAPLTKLQPPGSYRRISGTHRLETFEYNEYNEYNKYRKRISPG